MHNDLANWNNLHSVVGASFEEFRPVIFKIGITSDPEYRFWNRRYGYYLCGWHVMKVLFSGTPEQGIDMERHLINDFKNVPGCRNVARGGENPPKEAPCFVYIALANAAWSHLDSPRCRARRIKDKRLLPPLLYR